MDIHSYKLHVLHNATDDYFVEVPVRITPKFLITKAGKRFRRLDQPDELGAVGVQEGKRNLYLYPKTRAPKAYLDQIRAKQLQKEILESLC